MTPVKMRVSADTTTAPSFLCMKFPRKALVALLVNGKNTVTISGALVDGTPFSVTDTFRVHGCKKRHAAAKIHGGGASQAKPQGTSGGKGKGKRH